MKKLTAGNSGKISKTALERLLILKEFDRERIDSGKIVLAGIDEAGRGPLAGPVVASAAIVKDFDFKEKIDDSKKLSALQRERAFVEILRKCSVATAFVDHERIDEVNIFRATLEAMRDAFFGLKERSDLVLVDGSATVDLPCPVEAVPNGDQKSLAIACASIVAKVTRDRYMMYVHDSYPVYGFDKHKGYGTPQHLDALRRFGPCSLHRKSFAPVEATGQAKAPYLDSVGG